MEQQKKNFLSGNSATFNSSSNSEYKVEQKTFMQTIKDKIIKI